jgi:hypothetical protein
MLSKKAFGVKTMGTTNVDEKWCIPTEICALYESIGVVHVRPVHLVVAYRGHHADEAGALVLWVSCARREETGTACVVGVVVQLGYFDRIPIFVLRQESRYVETARSYVVVAGDHSCAHVTGSIAECQRKHGWLPRIGTRLLEHVQSCYVSQQATYFTVSIRISTLRQSRTQQIGLWLLIAQLEDLVERHLSLAFFLVCGSPFVPYSKI